MPNSLNPRMQDQEPIQHCGWPNCAAACCIYGAWVELPLVTEILENAASFSAHLPEVQQNPGAWFSEMIEEDPHAPGGAVRHTMTLPDENHYGGQACIFLRPDHKCALQVAGEANGEHPWRYKPFYCILHPLMLDDQGRITLDAAAEMVDEQGSCVRRAKHKVVPEKLFVKELGFLANHVRFSKTDGV